MIDQEFLWVSGKYSMWGPMSKGYAAKIGGENSQWRDMVEEIEQRWHNPGFDLARLWKVHVDGKDRYFAIAMTKYPVPGTRGHRLFARFELKNLIQ